MKMTHLRIRPLLIVAASLVLATFARADEHEHDHDHDTLKIRSGHLDLAVHYEEAEGLHLAFGRHDEDDHDHDHGHGGDEDHQHEHGTVALAEAELVVGPAGRQPIPDAEAFRFLGAAQQWHYVLPQSEDPDLPFLGLSTEALDPDAWTGDVTIELSAVEGPGTISLYTLDAFGQPTVLLQADASIDGVFPVASLPVGAHAHVNWSFSVPGEYELYLGVTATPVDGSPMHSEPQAMVIDVEGGPDWIDEGHSGLALSWDAEHGGLEAYLVAEEDDHDEGHGHGGDAHDDEHGHEEEHHGMHPSEAVVLLGGYAVRMVPDDAAYAFLGDAGSAIYTIPPTPAEGVPFFGMETEELDPAVFSGPVAFALEAVDGPGELFLYTVAEGAPVVHWNSADPGEDVYELSAGTHAHPAWAVTAAGSYRLTLHIHAPLADGEEAETEVVLHLQAGGMEGYFGHFERPTADWMMTEVPGLLYVRAWPWVASIERGWLWASGFGGPDQWYYSAEAEGWLWTSPEAFPLVWNASAQVWETWAD